MKDKINDIGRLTALLSFVIGTIFLALFLYYGEKVINIYAAILFIITALVVNTIILAVIVGRAVLKTANRLEAFKTILLMLSNVPFSIIYFYMVINFPSHSIL